MSELSRRPHQQKVGYKKDFNINSSESIADIRARGFDISLAKAIYHELRLRPLQSCYDIATRFDIKEGTSSARLRELVIDKKIYKAEDRLSKDPRSKKYVAHYKLVEKFPTAIIQETLFEVSKPSPKHW